MKGKINIGKISKEEILKVYKKASRDIELENSNGWVSINKVHKSLKSYSRKEKHKSYFL
jgi:hypothetical protein